MSITGKIVALCALLAVSRGQSTQNIVEIAQSTPQFSTLVTAVSTANLIQTLSSPGPFTVFAPTNDAFANLQDLVGILLEDQHRGRLTAILTYHVVSGTYTASDLTNGRVLTTVNGANLTVRSYNFLGRRRIQLFNSNGNGATVVAPNDVVAANGAIHSIDRVLVPIETVQQSVDEAEVVTCGANVTGNTRLYTSQLGNGSPDIFYRLNITSAFAVTISTCGSQYDTIVALYSGTNLTDRSTTIVTNDDHDGECGDSATTRFHSSIELVLQPGEYVIVLEGYEGNNQAGEFTLAIACDDVGSITTETPGTGITTTEAPCREIALLCLNCNTFWAAVTCPCSCGAEATTTFAPPLTTIAPSLNIVQVAQSTPQTFSTLVTAVVTANLATTLSGAGPFTVFAPTNDAFALLGNDTITNLLANPDQLSPILTYHVVSGRVLSSDLSDGQTITTVNGATLTVRIQNGGVQILNNDGSIIANVVTADVGASNGVIHVIDTVLIPAASTAVVTLSTNGISFLPTLNPASATGSSDGGSDSVTIGIIVAVGILFVAVAGAVAFVYVKRSSGSDSSSRETVAFENPAYGIVGGQTYENHNDNYDGYMDVEGSMA